jgi:hypothetical protein
MTEVIPVYIKGTDKVLQLEPAPKNPSIQGDQETNAQAQVLPKGDAKASAKSAKVTLVIDPASITRVNSEGKKQTKLTVTVGTMKFEAMVNSKSYRKALTAIDEYGIDGCHAILQATMIAFGKLDSAGLAVQPKAPKPVAEQEQEPYAW